MSNTLLAPLPTIDLCEDILDYLDPIFLDVPTGVFVESRAAQNAGVSLNLKVDYKIFLDYLGEMCHLHAKKYYWSLGMREEDGGAQRFLKYLNHCGWDTWASRAIENRSEKIPGTDFDQTCIAKFNPKIKLAVDALTMPPSIEQVVLFVRGSDYVPLIEALQMRGIRVISVGWSDRHVGADGLLDLRRIAHGLGSYRDSGHGG